MSYPGDSVEIAAECASNETAEKSKIRKKHPKYRDMIIESIAVLNEKGGSSRQAIVKYIMDNYDVFGYRKFVNIQVKKRLRADVIGKPFKEDSIFDKSGTLKNCSASKTEEEADLMHNPEKNGANAESAMKTSPKVIKKTTNSKNLE